MITTSRTSLVIHPVRSSRRTYHSAVHLQVSQRDLEAAFEQVTHVAGG